MPVDKATMHSRAIQCNQAPFIAILRKLGKGHHVHMCAWAEYIANVWLPYTNMGKLPSATTLILRHESIPAVSFDSFCVPNYILQCSQFLHELHYLNFFFKQVFTDILSSSTIQSILVL